MLLDQANYFRVVINTGQGKREKFISKTCFKIGRGKKMDIILPFDSISRCHTQIRLNNERIFITDLGSANGTRILGTRIPANIEIEYQAGQEIELGDAQVSLHVFPITAVEEDLQKRENSQKQAKNIIEKAKIEAGLITQGADEEAQNYKNELSKLKRELEEANHELLQLQNSIEREKTQFDLEKARIEVEVQKAEAGKIKITQELKDLEDRAQEARLAYENFNQGLDEARQEEKDLEAKKSENELILSEQNQSLAKLEEEISEYKDRKLKAQEEMEQAIAEKVNEQRVMSEKLSDKDALDSQLAKGEQDILELKDQLEKLEAQIEEKKQELAQEERINYQRELLDPNGQHEYEDQEGTKDQHANNQHLENELRSLQEEIKSLNIEKSQLENDLNQAKQVKSQILGEIEENQLTLGQLEKDKEQIEAYLEEISQTLKSEIEETERKLEALEDYELEEQDEEGDILNDQQTPPSTDQSSPFQSEYEAQLKAKEGETGEKTNILHLPEKSLSDDPEVPSQQTKKKKKKKKKKISSKEERELEKQRRLQMEKMAKIAEIKRRMGY